MSYKFTRGDTFAMTAPVTAINPADNQAMDVSGWGVFSMVHFPDSNRRVTLEAAWESAQTPTVTAMCADTSSWPLGIAETDFRFRSPTGQIITSPKTRFTVVEAATNAP